MGVQESLMGKTIVKPLLWSIRGGHINDVFKLVNVGKMGMRYLLIGFFFQGGCGLKWYVLNQKKSRFFIIIFWVLFMA